MNESIKHPGAVTTQDKAINEYLESLLLEVEDEPVVQAVPKPAAEPVLPEHREAEEIPNNVIGLEQLVAEVPEVITETAEKLDTSTTTEVVTEVEVETIVETQSEVEIEPQIESAEESAVPAWAQSRFQCLLFNVSGLSLAVPLVKLNSVIPWDDKITNTPNQTDWYLGLIQHLQQQIKVIDTALLVMPENRRGNIDTDPEKRLSHILLVDDYRWGLACDSIGDVIWLNQDEVKWRKDKSTRAWLSGTALEHLCAIMDTEVFAQMLNQGN